MLEGIREKKSKKSIKEGVEIIMRKNAEADMKKRIKTRRTFQKQYEDLAASTYEKDGHNDRAYNRILVTQDRLLKVLTGHSHAIDSLEYKLENILDWKTKDKAAKDEIEKSQ
jgi:hypothetical protein